MFYRTSYDILQTPKQKKTCHFGQVTMPFRHQQRTMHVISDKLRYPSDSNTEQCISYRTSYDVLHTVTQNNTCHIGQFTMSFRHQNRTMHVISNKLRYRSYTNTVQCMSNRKIYVVLQTPEQNNACHIGQDKKSNYYQHRTMHVIEEKLRCPRDIRKNNECHIGQATMSFRY